MDCVSKFINLCKNRQDSIFANDFYNEVTENLNIKRHLSSIVIINNDPKIECHGDSIFIIACKYNFISFCRSDPNDWLD